MLLKLPLRLLRRLLLRPRMLIRLEDDAARVSSLTALCKPLPLRREWRPLSELATPVAFSSGEEVWETWPLLEALEALRGRLMRLAPEAKRSCCCGVVAVGSTHAPWRSSPPRCSVSVNASRSSSRRASPRFSGESCSRFCTTSSSCRASPLFPRAVPVVAAESSSPLEHMRLPLMHVFNIRLSQSSREVNSNERLCAIVRFCALR